MNPLKKWARIFLDKLANGISNRLNLPLQSGLQSINQSSQLIQQSVEQSVQQLAKQPFRQYLGDGEIYVETKYFNMIVPGWDILLTPAILTSQVWEPALSNYLKERIKPGMITFDIGANMGWFSCLFASCGALVHAFEPNPRLQQILRKNIFLNAGRATNKCAVNQCAVSDNEGVVPMRFPHWLVGGASLHNYDQTSWLDSLIDEDINTDVVTLDAYAKKMNIEKVDLIKIDIEGFEEHALRGAADIISRSPGLILSIEFTRGQYSNSFPNWLFERFSEAYLPAFNRAIDLKFLHEYEAKTVLPEYSHIDIVFHARK